MLPTDVMASVERHADAVSAAAVDKAKRLCADHPHVRCHLFCFLSFYSTRSDTRSHLELIRLVAGERGDAGGERGPARRHREDPCRPARLGQP
jgi:hypothetical protein